MAEVGLTVQYEPSVCRRTSYIDDEGDPTVNKACSQVVLERECEVVQAAPQTWIPSGE